MERSRHNGKVNFNLTDEQQERFTLLYAETKKVYPHLTSSDVERERVKVILAHYIINEDNINKDIEEKKDKVINKDNDTE